MGSPKMFIVVSGTLSYINSEGEATLVTAGQWIADGTLWTTWTHLGDLMAVSDCRLFALDARKFQEIASQFEHTEWTTSYAAQFIENLNKLKDEELSDVSWRALEGDIMGRSLSNTVTTSKRSSKHTSVSRFHGAASYVKSMFRR